MRAATLIIVLAIHAMFWMLFALSRGPVRWFGQSDAPLTTWIFLPEGVKPVASVPQSPVAARAARPAARVTAPTVRFAPEPTPGSSSITPTPAPDWRAEAGIAANSVLEAEAQTRASIGTRAT